MGEGRFCAVQNFNCVDHKMKHYKFFVLLDDMTAPINCETINWAKNWLAQHIKNTDHQYKGRLDGPDSGDNFTVLFHEKFKPNSSQVCNSNHLSFYLLLI